VKAFILGVIITLICLAAGVYVYFAYGYAPVATSAQAMPFEKYLANKALHARVEKEMPKNPPFQPDEVVYQNGARIYNENCAVCHGQPGKQPTPIAQGMFPKPPELFRGKGVTDDPAAETYWKVANGIRLTGMPAFKGALSDAEIWNVAFLLANADKLPASATAILASSTPAMLPGSAPSTTPGGTSAAPGAPPPTPTPPPSQRPRRSR
jgi:mono/diheme cytochrome c family protein